MSISKVMIGLPKDIKQMIWFQFMMLQCFEDNLDWFNYHHSIEHIIITEAIQRSAKYFDMVFDTKVFCKFNQKINKVWFIVNHVNVKYKAFSRRTQYGACSSYEQENFIHQWFRFSDRIYESGQIYNSTRTLKLGELLKLDRRLKRCGYLTQLYSHWQQC